MTLRKYLLQLIVTCFLEILETPQVHMRSLTISCREDILKKGLSDSSKTVNKIVTKDLSKAFLIHIPTFSQHFTSRFCA